jgi:PTH1 family peptidyl-tRNA hydrolase
VLRKPPADERESIEKSIDETLTALDLLLAGELNAAMMKIHAKPQRPKPPRPASLNKPAGAPASAPASAAADGPKDEVEGTTK